MSQRLSVGGHVVADSLAHVGLESIPDSAALVETTRQRTLRVVMVQNAWNVVGTKQFLELLRPYGWKWRLRAAARRAVSQVNLRRAQKVVCLTEAVAAMARPSSRGRVVVAPVSFPAHLPFPSEPTGSPTAGTALVVGALTWYKRPALALEVLTRSAPEVTRVTFLGSGDEEVWVDVERLAGIRGLEVTRRKVSHEEMPELYASAAVTVLPSALESLGFGVTEAMAFGHRVLAADIPAHRDAARAFGGRQPEWFDDRGEVVEAAVDGPGRVTAEQVLEQWRAVAREMTTP